MPEAHSAEVSFVFSGLGLRVVVVHDAGGRDGPSLLLFLSGVKHARALGGRCTQGSVGRVQRIPIDRAVR